MPKSSSLTPGFRVTVFPAALIENPTVADAKAETVDEKALTPVPPTLSGIVSTPSKTRAPSDGQST